MKLKERLVKEKTHLFWTFPIITMLLTLVNSGGILFLMFMQGKWEGFLVVPPIFLAWVVLWYTGRKKLYIAELDYVWGLVTPWNKHLKDLKEVKNQLDRIESKLEKEGK